MIFATIDFFTALGLLYLFYHLEMRLNTQPSGNKALMMRNVHGLKISTRGPLGDFNHGTSHLKDILRPSEDSDDEEQATGAFLAEDSFRLNDITDEA